MTENFQHYNIAFFGTSDRTTGILDELNKKGHLRLCITKKDTLVGRDRKTRETGVKSWAKSHNIPHIEIDNLKGDNLNNITALLNEHKISVIIVTDFSFIIPKALLINPSISVINIHFSLLPKYRGASPVQFSILNGDEETGITYQLVHEKMDYGDIIYQQTHPIEKTDTSETLNKKLFLLTESSITKVIEDFYANKLHQYAQDHTKATYTYSKTNPKTTQIVKEDAHIDWNTTDEEIERAIRAFNPWPIAWTSLDELMKSNRQIVKNLTTEKPNFLIKIYKARIENGKLTLLSVKPEGKNEMDWNSFRNGYLKGI